MIKKIKEGILPYFPKKHFIFVAFFALAGITVPFAFANSQILGDSAPNIANNIAGVFLFIIATASYAFANISDWFLRLTLNPEFITAPFTPIVDPSGALSYGLPEGNQFVGYGWTIVRDFVNMFFIIILIIIGLSTSLQIETYKWQKTLPRLVMVALLINFTPIILGVFIDGSNFMMNFFVGSENSIARESAFVVKTRPLYDTLASNLSGVSWARFTSEAIDPIATMLMFTFFNTIVGITYLFYGAIFALRYVALWLLIIISPFGLFCYILPATQDFFRTWFRWFIGWSIIGIVGGLFLHLGEVMRVYIDHHIQVPSTHHAGISVGAFAHIFPELIPLLFSLFGVFITIAVSIAGSKGIVMGLQTASGTAKKTMPNIPRSNFKERSQAAGAAIKNAFSTGTATAPMSSTGKGSSMTAAAGGRGLHTRQVIGQETQADIKSSSRPITEVATHATRGAEDATMTIAAAFESSIPNDSSSVTSTTKKTTLPGGRGSLSGLSSSRRDGGAEQKDNVKRYTERFTQSAPPKIASDNSPSPVSPEKRIDNSSKQPSANNDLRQDTINNNPKIDNNPKDEENRFGDKGKPRTVDPGF